jgi:hypothetical protein
MANDTICIAGRTAARDCKITLYINFRGRTIAVEGYVESSIQTQLDAIKRLAELSNGLLSATAKDCGMMGAYIKDLRFNYNGCAIDIREDRFGGLQFYENGGLAASMNMNTNNVEFFGMHQLKFRPGMALTAQYDPYVNDVQINAGDIIKTARLGGNAILAFHNSMTTGTKDLELGFGRDPVMDYMTISSADIAKNNQLVWANMEHNFQLQPLLQALAPDAHRTPRGASAAQARSGEMLDLRTIESRFGNPDCDKSLMEKRQDFLMALDVFLLALGMAPPPALAPQILSVANAPEPRQRTRLVGRWPGVRAASMELPAACPSIDRHGVARPDARGIPAEAPGFRKRWKVLPIVPAAARKNKDAAKEQRKPEAQARKAAAEKRARKGTRRKGNEPQPKEAKKPVAGEKKRQRKALEPHKKREPAALNRDEIQKSRKERRKSAKRAINGEAALNAGSAPKRRQKNRTAKPALAATEKIAKNRKKREAAHAATAKEKENGKNTPKKNNSGSKGFEPLTYGLRVRRSGQAELRARKKTAGVVNTNLDTERNKNRAQSEALGLPRGKRADMNYFARMRSGLGRHAMTHAPDALHPRQMASSPYLQNRTPGANFPYSANWKPIEGRKTRKAGADKTQGAPTTRGAPERSRAASLNRNQKRRRAHTSPYSMMNELLRAPKRRGRKRNSKK